MYKIELIKKKTCCKGFYKGISLNRKIYEPSSKYKFIKILFILDPHLFSEYKSKLF